MSKTRSKLATKRETLRPILATLEHSAKHWLDRGQRKARRYSSPENALPRAISWLLSCGRTGSVIEIACTETGIQFATVRLTAQGKIDLAFNFMELQK